MISMELARQLKAVGLAWEPQRNDFFMIPDRGLDERVFVVSDMTVLVEELQGQMAVTFHGIVEWALDFVMVADVVWLPTEGQLRTRLEQHLVGEPEPSLVLVSTADGYRCEIVYQGEFLAFEAFGASEVYGLALHYVLQSEEA